MPSPARNGRVSRDGRAPAPPPASPPLFTAVPTAFDVVDTRTHARVGRIEVLGDTPHPPLYGATVRPSGAALGWFETLEGAVAAFDWPVKRKGVPGA